MFEHAVLVAQGIDRLGQLVDGQDDLALDPIMELSPIEPIEVDGSKVQKLVGEFGLGCPDDG